MREKWGKRKEKDRDREQQRERMYAMKTRLIKNHTCRAFVDAGMGNFLLSIISFQSSTYLQNITSDCLPSLSNYQTILARQKCVARTSFQTKKIQSLLMY